MEYTEQQQALLQKVTALQQEKQLSQNALENYWGFPARHYPSCETANIKPIRSGCLTSWNPISA